MMEGPILVVAAHADDEALGLAGTIALATRRGVEVHVLLLSTSVVSRNLPPAEELRVRRMRIADAKAVADLLQTKCTIEDFPDNGFDTVPSLQFVALVEKHLHNVRPKTVVTHWPGDLSLDHRMTSHAVITACRPQPGNPLLTLLAFEVRSSTDWMPDTVGMQFQANVYVVLDDESWKAKLSALNLYKDELRSPTHARSIQGLDALARMRGTEIGYERAEAFALLREVVST